MGETTNEGNRQRLKNEVLVELANYLRDLSNKPKNRVSFFDRPIVLTLIGTVLLTLATTYWGTMQHRYDLKLELLRTLPMAHQKTGNILNQRIVHVIWVAEENNKSKTEQCTANIKSWSKKINFWEQEYAKADDVDGILSMVQALYVRPEVRRKAKAMKERFRKLVDLLQETNQIYNTTHSLPRERLKEIKVSRVKLINELDDLKDQILVDMGRELSGFMLFGIFVEPLS